MAVPPLQRPASARDFLEHRCEDVLAAELTRLAGRAPGLRAAHLEQIRAALRRVIEQLVLSRAHKVRDDQIAALFGLAEVRQ